MARLIIPADTRLYEQLERLVRAPQMVFFAGLPGTGKSLLIHQLAHLTRARGCAVHLLQWDVARPVFEAHPAGQRYPVREGVTHGVIRKAVGLWVRQAIVRWHQAHAGFDHLLLGEIPCIGNRFIELARVEDDAAEGLLTAASTVFVIPVPSPDVRCFIDCERARRRVHPVHAQELEDAPPQVLRALWEDLACTAPLLGIDVPCQTAPRPYDPMVYQKVYEALLRHRHTQVMAIDILLPTTTLSVYDFDVPPASLIPTDDEVAAYIEAVEQQFPLRDALQDALGQWYLV
jgi:hypothetical protein